MVWRTSLLVDLDGGLVVVDSNDFAYQVLVSNANLHMSTQTMETTGLNIQVRTWLLRSCSRPR